MRQSEVNEWLHDQCVSVLNDTSLVTLQADTTDHVGMAERREEDGHGPYPFVAIQPLTSVGNPKGIGNGDLVVAELAFTNNILDTVTYAGETEYRVELHVLTDSDQQLRDDLSDELYDYFQLFARTGNTLTSPDLPADIDPPEVEEATPSGRVEDFVRADGVTMTLPYTRYIVDEDPSAVDSVSLDVDIGDGDTNVAEPTNADAYDTTY